jgi:hypothetical protein
MDMESAGQAGPLVANSAQFGGLVAQTYVLAGVVALLSLALAYLVANQISYEGSARPRDPMRRRLWYALLGLVLCVGFFLYNVVLVAPTVRAAFLDRFRLTSALAFLVSAAVYLVGGFLLARLLPHSRFATIFPGRRS